MSSNTHVLVEQFPWFPATRLHQLDLAGGEADEEHCRVWRSCGRVKVVTRGIRSLVEFLVDRLVDVRTRLRRR